MPAADRLLDCLAMGTDRAEETEFRLSLGDRLEEVEQAASRAEEVLRGSGVADDVVDAVGLAVREAVGNAIKHGNEMLPGSHVEMEFRLLDRWVEVEVRDQGGGFDPDSLPDPLAPENLLKPCGRGIFLMRRNMDEVSFRFEEGGGTAVKMRKRIGGDE